jgi:hypothetical protein
MANDSNAPGCRETAITTGLFLVAAVALVAIGLTTIGRDACTGWCETAGLAALYAGGPVSAVLGVTFGGVHVAWPLDVTFWVAAGFITARWAEKRARSAVAAAVTVLLLAVVYGLVLSQFVELDIPG